MSLRSWRGLLVDPGGVGLGLRIFLRKLPAFVASKVSGRKRLGGTEFLPGLHNEACRFRGTQLKARQTASICEQENVRRTRRRWYSFIGRLRDQLKLRCR